MALLPWGRELPLSHIGNIVNAVLISYATIRHKLVDIKFVVRGGLVWASVGVIAILAYWSILLALQTLAGMDIDFGIAGITSLLAG